jgi:D-alanine-D-alanine ligase
MRIAITHNDDSIGQEEDPTHQARVDVIAVARGLAHALGSKGHDVELVALDSRPLLRLSRMCVERPDVVLNLCESLHRDARGEALVPLACDLAGLPYTGSGPFGLYLALHKHKAKEVLRARGVPTPDWRLLESLPDEAEAAEILAALGAPVILKPCREDASSGIHADSVVSGPRELVQRVSGLLKAFRQPVLVERFVSGREINVPLLGAPVAALPISEIDFSALPDGFPPVVTYAGKWAEGSLEYRATPAKPCALDEEVRARVVAVARAAFSALECRDYGRVDIRLAGNGTPFVIDVNPNCDLSPVAGFARSAAAAGLAYGDLAELLVRQAQARHDLAHADGGRQSAPIHDAVPHSALSA